MHSSSTEKFDPVTTMAVNDVDHVTKKKKRPYFDWIQLIATIWIPIVIAIYTIVENKSNESIADSNRLKDTQLANISRASELEIALANRLNELDIAEQSRQKDRDLATDHQHQTILGEYQSFLAKLIIDHGANLDRKPEAKIAAHFMTFMALKQLDTKRRGILLRSLYDAKLITVNRSASPDSSSIIDLRQADLAGIQFGLSSDVPDPVPRVRFIIWQDLWLPYTTLTNASFRHTLLDGASFAGSYMDFTDLSFAVHLYRRAGNVRYPDEVDFRVTSLVNASFYEANLRNTDFSMANLTWANLHGLKCEHYSLSNKRVSCQWVNLSRAIAHSARYFTIDFDHSDWSQIEASTIRIYNCTFTAAKMENPSFMNSFIDLSDFRNASLYATDLSHARMGNVSFVNADMRNADLRNIVCSNCTFINANLHEALLKNASFRYSNFRNCSVADAQLAETADLAGSILPNGTIVGSKS